MLESDGRTEIDAAYLVSVQALEELNCLCQIVSDLLLRRVIGVAARFDSVDACSYAEGLVGHASTPDLRCDELDLPCLFHSCSQKLSSSP